MEIVGGIALLVVSPALILRVIEFLTQDEIAEDPRDLVANYLLDAARCSAAISMRPATVRMGIRHRGNGMIVAA